MDVILKKKEEKALNSQPWPKSADLQSDPHIDRWVFAFCEPWYCAKLKSIRYAKFRSTSACDDHNVWVLIELNDMAIFFAEIKLQPDAIWLWLPTQARSYEFF